jgi:hypothetical protein
MILTQSYRRHSRHEEIYGINVDAVPL